uniref:SAM domain-containing protein n=1 Tax=Paramormyrops kingsleyae TaxID=1676925 RepID=A0A3B3T6G3_9TELE
SCVRGPNPLALGCPLLDEISPNQKVMAETDCRRSGLNSLATFCFFLEIEAKEACDWLRAAGFPQYAHLYEDSQLPIDISSVKRDHDFLDKDLVEPLCRRLNTLNKCASMKLDVSLPKKKVSADLPDSTA